MDEFDPKSFLAEDSKEEFDPKAFLAEGREDTDLNDIAIKTANGGAFGMMPYLSGLTEAAGQAVGVKGAGGPLADEKGNWNWSTQSPAGLDTDKLSQAYDEGYTKEKGLQDEIQKRSPYLSFASELGGGLVTGSSAGKLLAPIAEEIPYLNKILSPAEAMPNLTEAGSMDFAKALPKAPFMQRVAENAINSAPLATAIGAAQPTEKPGLNMPERAQNAALANILNVPIAGAVESFPAVAGRVANAAKKTADLIPDRTRAAFNQGVEGYWLKGQEIKDKIADMTSKAVKSFENPIQQIKLQRKIDSDSQIALLKDQMADLDIAAHEAADQYSTAVAKYKLSTSGYHQNEIDSMVNIHKHELETKLEKINGLKEQNLKRYKTEMQRLHDETTVAQDDLKTYQSEVINKEAPRELSKEYQDSVAKDFKHVGKLFDASDKFAVDNKLTFNLKPSLEKFYDQLPALGLDATNPKAFEVVFQTIKPRIDEGGNFTAKELREFINGIASGDVKSKSQISRIKHDIFKTESPDFDVFNQLLEKLRQDVRGQQIEQMEAQGFKKEAKRLKFANEAYTDLIPRKDLIEKNKLTGDSFDVKSLANDFKKTQDYDPTVEDMRPPEILQELESAVTPNIKEFRKIAPLSYIEEAGATSDELSRLKKVLSAINRAKTDPRLNIRSQIGKQTIGVDDWLSQKAPKYQELLNRINNKDYSGMDPAVQNKISESEQVLESLATGENTKLKEMLQAKRETLRDNITEKSGLQDQVRTLENPKITNTLDELVAKTENPEQLQKSILDIITKGADTTTPAGAGTAVDRLDNLIMNINNEAKNSPEKKDLTKLVDAINLYKEDLYGVLGFNNVASGKAAASAGVWATLSDRAANLAGKMTPKSFVTPPSPELIPQSSIYNRFKQYKVVNGVLKNFDTTIGELKNADSVKRAAMVNAILQNPDLRKQVDPEELKKMLGVD